MAGRKPHPDRARFDKPAEPGQRVCSRKGCGRGVWWSGNAKGKRPTVCGVHSSHVPKRSYVPLVENERKVAERTARDRWAAERQARSRGRVKVTNVLRLAFGLTATDDLEEAAAIGGVFWSDDEGRPRAPTPDELEQLGELARSDDLAGIRDGRDQDVAAVWRKVALMAGIRSLETVEHVPPQMLPLFGQTAQRVVESLGGKRATYATATVGRGRVKKRKAS